MPSGFLSAIAYNLGNLWLRLVLPTRIDNWSPTSLQQRLVKTGRRLIEHARYYWLLLAEGHLTRSLFGAMLRRLAVVPGAAGEQKLWAQATRAARKPGTGSFSGGQNGLFWGSPGTDRTENRAGTFQWKVVGSPKWKSRLS